MSRLCFSSILLLFVHRSANADYIVYTMYSDSHCKVGLKGEQFQEDTCYHYIEAIGGWFGNLDDDVVYKLECDWLTDSVVGVQYHWPQEMLHASVNNPNASVNAESDQAVCDDSLPEGTPGAPTGKRIPRQNDVCVGFSPPRFAPWSYKVQCMKGKRDPRGDFGNLVPYPDANVIRNEPGHPEHGQMISSECAICTKKNSVSIAPHNDQLCEESPQMLCPKKWDPVTQTGQTWRMPCLNLKYQHSGSMSDGALSTSTSRYKAHMIIGLDREGLLRHDWDWCCAPNAHSNNEACFRECLNEEDCRDERPGLLTSRGRESNIQKEPWLGDLSTKCGVCAVDKNGLNTLLPISQTGAASRGAKTAP